MDIKGRKFPYQIFPSSYILLYLSYNYYQEKIFILLAIKTTEMSPIPNNYDIYYDGHLLYAMTHDSHQDYRLYYTFSST